MERGAYLFSMASIRIIVSCLLVSSRMLEAKSEKFVTVHCQKSEIVAQYGTNTLLDCVVKTSKSDVTTETVIWRLDGVKILTFHAQKVKIDNPSFQFAKDTLDGSDVNVSLLITNTNLSHAGVYQCEVLTDSGTDESRVQVKVKSNYSKPIIDSDPEKITPDKDFTLTCEAHGGFPEGKIRWVVDGHTWRMNPKEEIKKTPNGLYSMTSKLSFGPHSVFAKFDCEVYNANEIKEGQATFDKTYLDEISDSPTKGNSLPQIVAPVLVIGSLIVGLLLVLVCRRRRQNVLPPGSAEETNQMV